MARKFSKKAFREWLDCIAKVTCKTDDNFTCQMRLSENCAGAMLPLDKNCQWCHIKSKESYKVRWLPENAITGCGQCHAYAHDNPDEFIRWFKKAYPHRTEIIESAKNQPNKIWRESDFLEMEKVLLQEALAVGVDYINATKWHGFRMRLKKKLEALKEKATDGQAARRM